VVKGAVKDSIPTRKHVERGAQVTLTPQKPSCPHGREKKRKGAGFLTRHLQKNGTIGGGPPQKKPLQGRVEEGLERLEG